MTHFYVELNLMKKAKSYAWVWLMIVLLTACNSPNQTKEFPTDSNTENCAADGVGCKQYNEDLNR